jgi:hypothetical protein
MLDSPLRLGRTSWARRWLLGTCLGTSMIALPAGASAGQAAPVGAQATALQAEITRLRSEIEELRRQYEARLADMEKRLAGLTAAAPAATPTPTDPAALPPGSARVFNPDTSVIGNFLGAVGKNPASADPLLQLSEAEVSFTAAVDPYARADFFLAAGPEGVEVEEGYVTFTALPAKLQLKAGKLRAQFGKVNTLHTHALPTADRPLVTGNLLGGEEGLSDGGLSLSRIIDNPLAYLEATAEIYAGTGDVFQSARRARPTVLGRLRAYRDLSEDKNLDFGVSYARGQTDVGLADGLDLSKQLFGVDATFRYRPLRRAIYQRLNVRTELIWSRQQLDGASTTTAFGFYGLGEYQFARRWYAGARLDRSGRALDGLARDHGGSVFLTFWPTEFSQIRSQYRRTSYAEGTTANELLFQVNFSIGAHGAHVF